MKLVRSLLILGAATLAGGVVAQPAPSRPDPSRVWIDRGWEFRYILLVERVSGFEASAEVGRGKLKSARPLHESYIAPYAFFEPSHQIATQRTSDKPNGDEGKNLAVLAIQFDESRAVLTPNRAPAALFGRLNRIQTIVLAPGNAPTDFQVRVGYFYVGPDAGASATPAICNTEDIDKRYKPRAEFDILLGRFGCREWGHYLQNPQYPYIDVTSYEPKKAEFLEYWELDPKTGKDELRETDARIAEFIGWGRFDIPPKPVIGQHVGKWFCLHECPDGEAPGRIPDIRAWAAKRGWPVPQRPKRMPLFPDPPRKPGSFID